MRLWVTVLSCGVAVQMCTPNEFCRSATYQPASGFGVTAVTACWWCLCGAGMFIICCIEVVKTRQGDWKASDRAHHVGAGDDLAQVCIRFLSRLLPQFWVAARACMQKGLSLWMVPWITGDDKTAHCLAIHPRSTALDPRPAQATKPRARTVLSAAAIHALSAVLQDAGTGAETANTYNPDTCSMT